MTSTRRPYLDAAALEVHHAAIATEDLDATITWYSSLLSCSCNWETDEFSSHTRKRAPGIKKMAELQVGLVRLHVFEVNGDVGAQLAGQHLGIKVSNPSDLEEIRSRASRLSRGAIEDDDSDADVDVDQDGVMSLYVVDPNGYELEFTYIPPGIER
jgi:catechol 2,3-dioxygenase-like lactoylglutathione lyase family enzyme